MQFLNSLTWWEVWQIWQDNEVKLKRWQKIYQANGFKSWQEWRQTYVRRFKLDKFNWNLYQINDPLAVIPSFYGGPFSKWKEYFYQSKNTLTFQQLSQLTTIKNYSYIKELTNNFPPKTTLIGLLKKKKIYIIDGMHRCCAIALLSQSQQKLNSNIKIALGDYA